MLPAMLLLAVAASAVFPAPGTYRYSASLSGQRIGEWSVSVKPSDGGSEIDENSTASFAGMQLAATASLVLAADLAPMRYEGSYRMAGQSPTVSVTLTPSSATIVGGIGATTRTLGAPTEYPPFRRDRTGPAGGAFRAARTATSVG